MMRIFHRRSDCGRGGRAAGRAAATEASSRRAARGLDKCAQCGKVHPAGWPHCAKCRAAHPPDWSTARCSGRPIPAACRARRARRGFEKCPGPTAAASIPREAMPNFTRPRMPLRSATCPVCAKAFNGRSLQPQRQGGVDRDFCRHSLGRDVVEALVWSARAAATPTGARKCATTGGTGPFGDKVGRSTRRRC